MRGASRSDDAQLGLGGDVDKLGFYFRALDALERFSRCFRKLAASHQDRAHPARCSPARHIRCVRLTFVCARMWMTRGGDAGTHPHAQRKTRFVMTRETTRCLCLGKNAEREQRQEIC